MKPLERARYSVRRKALSCLVCAAEPSPNFALGAEVSAWRQWRSHGLRLTASRFKTLYRWSVVLCEISYVHFRLISSCQTAAPLLSPSSLLLGR
jgi:hypothetical protein